MPLILMHGIDNKKMIAQLFSKLFRENLHNMAENNPSQLTLQHPLIVSNVAQAKKEEFHW